MTTMVRAALVLFGSLLTVFFASNYDRGLLLPAAFWSGLGLLILMGALPKVPKRNAILVIPATALATFGKGHAFRLRRNSDRYAEGWGGLLSRWSQISIVLGLLDKCPPSPG